MGGALTIALTGAFGHQSGSGLGTIAYRRRNRQLSDVEASQAIVPQALVASLVWRSSRAGRTLAVGQSLLESVDVGGASCEERVGVFGAEIAEE